jgi:hypothetical protein
LSNNNESAIRIFPPNISKLNTACIHTEYRYRDPSPIVMKSIEATSTCVGRITDGRANKRVLSVSIQDKEKGWSNAVMQQLGATASHGGGATQPGNSRWRCHAFRSTHQGTRGEAREGLTEDRGRLDGSIGHLPVVGNGNGNCLSGAHPCRLALAPGSGFFNATSCPWPPARPLQR